ncbi:entericidin A/B family lipoprotein [Legionella sp. CNM-4043-24]
MKRMIALVLLCVLSTSLLSACNTVKGFGKDVSQGGRDIQRAAS